MTLVSVRGEARLTVDPDSVRLPGLLTATADDKAAALRAGAVALRLLTDDLGRAGGAALTARAVRQPLTWSAHRTRTEPEHVVDPSTGQYAATGRVRAVVSVTVVLRDLGRTDEVGEVLARHEGLALHDALWGVDDDNPAWAQVRAAAVQDAVHKGRDYAAALGGALAGLEHLADEGLLAGAAEQGWRAAAFSAERGSGGLDVGDVPSLDPVPQQLVAVVEARFKVRGMTLPAPS